MKVPTPRSLLAILLGLAAPCVLLAGVQDPERFASAEALQLAFEQAVAERDQDRVERLIHRNQNYLFDLFETYAKEWITDAGRTGEERDRVLERADAIARAAFDVFHGEALLDMVEALLEFDKGERKLWMEASDLLKKGETAADQESWREAIEIYRAADCSFNKLGWVFGVANARLRIGCCLFRLSDYEQALTLLQESSELFEQTGSPYHQEVVVERLGWAFGMLGRFQECRGAYEQAGRLSERVDASYHIWRLHVAGTALCKWGQHDTALAFFEKERDAARAANDRTGLGRALLWIASCCYNTSRSEEAVEAFVEMFEVEPDAYRDEFERRYQGKEQQGIAEFVDPQRGCWLFEKYAMQFITATGPLDPRYGALDRLNAMADAAARVHQTDRWQRDVEALQRLDSNGKKEWMRSYTTRSQAHLAHERSAHQDAVRLMSDAAALYEKVGWSMGLAEAKHYLGHFSYLVGDCRACLECLEQAATIYDQLGNSLAGAHSRTLLGRYLVTFGLYERALAVLEQALAVKERAGDLYGRAFCHREIGYCYQALNQFDKSILHLEQAAALWQRLDNRPEMARSRTLLGTVYNSFGRPDEALGQLESALALQKPGIESAVVVSGKQSDWLLLPETLIQLGVTLNLLERPREAIERYEAALALLEKTGQVVYKAWALNGLGMSCFALGRDEDARSFHQRALESLEKVDQHRDSAWSLQNLAKCDHALGRYEETLLSLERCVQHLDRVGRRILPEEGRNTFLSQWSSIPALACNAAFELHRHASPDAIARGLPLVDYFLGRTLLEGLQERAEDVLSAADPGLAAEREQVLNEMESLRIGLADAGPADGASLTSERERLQQAEQRLDDLNRRLRGTSPNLQHLISPAAASMTSMREKVLRPDEALLFYVLGEKASYVWVIDREKAELLRLAPAQEIQRQYELLSRALEPLGPRDLGFIAPARALHGLLLADALAFTSRRNLIIIPDGFLGFLSFDVLLTRDTEENGRARLEQLPYLVRERTVRYAPSASFLVWSAEQQRAPTTDRKDMLLLGDPLYSVEPEELPEIALRSMASLRPERLARLLKTREEVKGIAQLLLGSAEREPLASLENLPRNGSVHGARFDLYCGSEATKIRLHEDLERYRILHLAVHGYVDHEYPWFSGLVLSRDDTDHSSFLNLVEIASLKLDADLVFLSACDTARGQVAKAEGIKNTARSFLLAGARSVVATQWTVSDEASALLANRFYEELFSGSSAVEALRSAKLDMLGARTTARPATLRGIVQVESDLGPTRLAHPSFWAPFVLWGR